MSSVKAELSLEKGQIVGLLFSNSVNTINNCSEDRRSTLRALLLLLCLAFLVSYTAPSHAQREPGGFYPGLGGDFTLQSHRGEVLFSELPGEWRLLGFGYSHCPDICSMLMAKMRQVYLAVSKRVEDYDQQLGVVFVSVDSKRDSGEGVASLQTFVDRFDQRFIGLSGDAPSIKEVTKKYAVYFGEAQLKEMGIEPRISHTDRIYLVNRSGKVKKIYSRSASTDQLAADLVALLR